MLAAKSHQATFPVCSYPAGNTKQGLCDLIGNVSEWVSDWYGKAYYGVAPADAPRGPEEGRYKVVRGGGTYPPVANLAEREREEPTTTSRWLGFRCVRDVARMPGAKAGDDLVPTPSPGSTDDGHGGLGFKGPGDAGDRYARRDDLGKIDTGGGEGGSEAPGGASTEGGGPAKPAKKIRGRIRTGSIKTTGFCKRREIESVVRSRQDAIRSCYEAQLQSKPDLHGKVVVVWTIKLDGRVKSAGLDDSTLDDARTESCLRRVFHRMRFPKPEGGHCVARLSFVFDPGL